MKAKRTSSNDAPAIGELLYSYALALDSANADMLADCWLPGVLSEESIDVGIAFHKKYARTMHNVMSHVYTVDGDIATGTCYCVATFIRDDSERMVKFEIHFQYEDQLVKQDNRWYFRARDIERVFSTDPVPIQEGFPSGFFDE